VAAWKKPAIVLASGALALGASLGVANLAYADTTPTPSPTSAPTVPTPEDGLPGGPGNPADGGQEDALVEELSNVLGVDKETIKAALDQLRAAYEVEGPAVLDQWLDAAVESGILTQDEADAVRKAVEQGNVTVGPR
jgi:hypothetical protein